jgi:hypothetical protein
MGKARAEPPANLEKEKTPRDIDVYGITYFFKWPQKFVYHTPALFAAWA